MNRDGEALIGCLIGLPIVGLVLLFCYGVFVLVIRYAFGIELPNPLDILPAEWADLLRAGS